MFSLTIVSGASMEPTLIQGDLILLDRWSITTNREIKRGEIVVISAVDDVAPLNGEPIAIYNKKENLISKIINENKEKTYVKRIIGLPGEKIDIIDGKVYINDNEVIDELSGGSYYTENFEPFCSLTVPEGCVYVLGDNRNNSTDSREFGCIPIEKIEGKVLIRVWPINKFGVVKIKEIDRNGE